MSGLQIAKKRCQHQIRSVEDQEMPLVTAPMPDEAGQHLRSAPQLLLSQIQVSSWLTNTGIPLQLVPFRSFRSDVSRSTSRAKRPASGAASFASQATSRSIRRDSCRINAAHPCTSCDAQSFPHRCPRPVSSSTTSSVPDTGALSLRFVNCAVF